MFFIDGGYLREELKRLFGNDDLAHTPFIELLKDELKSNFFLETIRVYYYDGDPDPADPKYQDKKAYLVKIKSLSGFELRLGSVKKIEDRFRQKGVDGLIAIDMLSKAYQDHYDIAVLIAGDEDIKPVVDAVKDAGKRVYGVFFSQHISKELDDSFDKRFVISNDWIARLRGG